jgi:Right handed beta helix region
MDAKPRRSFSEVAAGMQRVLPPRWQRLLLCLLLAGGASLAHAQTACEATDHGVRTDAADNSAALSKVLKECAGQTVHIAGGTYLFNPTGFAVGIEIPSGTTLLGDGSQGAQATVLQVGRAGTFQGLLWVRNAVNVTVRGLRFEGTAYESGCTRHLDYGHAIYVRSDRGAPAGVAGVTITENLFHNFNGTSWVDVNAMDDSPGVTRVLISNNVFNSDADLGGGCLASGLMSDIGTMVSVHGSDKTPDTGLISNVTIANNSLSAGYVKEGVSVWAGTSGTAITNNVIADTGLHLPRGASQELGRYAILIYNSAGFGPGIHPSTLDVIGNVITNPVSCGIYVNTAQNLRILNNKISGQTDRYDGTLIKGAIALNHGTNVTVENNELSNNYIAISSIGSTGLQVGTNAISVPPGGLRTKIR